ncbi:hypothetical protein B7486_73400 [cyanobacterium TDX16]|nr:hypothetical protein B7486_73400 [cyanobacterium TDX16]
MNIIACRPASPAGILKWLLATGEEPVPYAGSVKGVCRRCGQEVWIGPRQQEFIATCRRDEKPCEVMCVPCTAPFAAGDAEVKSLGNPEKPK